MGAQRADGRRTGAGLAAAACAIGALGVYLAAFHLSAAAEADARTSVALVGAIEPHSKPVNDFVGLVDPARFALLAAAVIAIALVQRRFAAALCAAIAIVGSGLTTQVLKVLTEAPRPGAGQVLMSWPSGHMTGAAALALCLVLVLPGWLRPAGIALGVVWMLAIACSIVTLGMHLPSDVVGGTLIAGAWTGLAVAVLRLRPALGRWAPSARAPVRAPR